MKNPFEYGGVVTGSAFCNREKEVADLLRAIENNVKKLQDLVVNSINYMEDLPDELIRAIEYLDYANEIGACDEKDDTDETLKD